jgi:hypothetical protein
MIPKFSASFLARRASWRWILFVTWESIYNLKCFCNQKEKLTNRKAFMICFNIVDGAHNNYTLKS